jgi:replication-associated recombination protein RarA
MLSLACYAHQTNPIEREHGGKIMSEFMSYDPWRGVTTRNGISGDLVISALQKSIRRGLAEEAVTFAYEMYITSQQFEEKLWRRLQAISVEDVGFGDLSAPVLINALNQMRQNFPYADGDRPIFFVHAIRYLASAKKDRASDNLKNIVKTEFEYGRKPVIPDFALDMHTQRGREMGRDFKHFLAEGSRVENELPVDDNYKTRLLDLLDRIEREEPEKVEDAFVYSSWQA